MNRRISVRGVGPHVLVPGDPNELPVAVARAVVLVPVPRAPRLLLVCLTPVWMPLRLRWSPLRKSPVESRLATFCVRVMLLSVIRTRLNMLLWCRFPFITIMLFVSELTCL